MIRNLATTCAFAIAMAIAAPLCAADPEGVWLTPPDKKGQTAHITTTRCGNAYCGTITKIFDRSGQPIDGKNLGVRVFWNMRPSGDKLKGRAYVPAYGKEYPGRIVVKGDRMKVSGCLGAICQAQTWTRVR